MKIENRIRRIMKRTWANKPIRIEKCPMILDSWGTHIIGKGGSTVICGTCGRSFTEPKVYTEEMKILALIKLFKSKI
jgi:hypothetical protein